MKTLLSLLMSFSVLFLNVHAQSAGKCISQSPKEAFASSQSVFIGTVLSISEYKSDQLTSGDRTTGIGNLYKVRARVEKSWKGVESKEITFLIYLGGWRSRFATMKEEEKFLVYVYRWEWLDELFAPRCSRTNKVEYAKEDLAYLGKGKKIS